MFLEGTFYSLIQTLAVGCIIESQCTAVKTISPSSNIYYLIGHYTFPVVYVSTISSAAAEKEHCSD